jgi:two-component system OmpR family sensor kinase
MMIKLHYKRYLLPIVLGALGLLLLARVFLIDSTILIPEDLDVVLLVSILGVIMVAATHAIVRISMHYLRLLSVQRVRQEALAEHSRFLQRLDHELKNPLTTLRTGLKTLSLTSLDGRQQHIVETMEAETIRLSRLVTDLRKLAELETHPLNLQQVDIEGFLRNIVHIEQERLETKQCIFTTQIDMPQKIWVIDEDLLALAVHNLLDNAFKYTYPGDTVHLEISGPGELIIRVTDTGIGIPQEAIPHIWEELYRAKQPEKFQGNGIGLALVKTIVQRHQGNIGIVSEQGKGTAVSLHIPILPQQ